MLAFGTYSNILMVSFAAANIQINSETITPFGKKNPITNEFDRVLSQTVDFTLGFKCRLFGSVSSERNKHFWTCCRV